MTTGAVARRLIDRFRFQPKVTGEVQILAATTYNLDPDFFEHDLLPTVLGIPNAEDHSYSGRIAMQRKLAACDFCGVLVDAGAYQGRPSLRTVVRPIPLRGAKLHAKVVAIGYEHALRMAVGSANLTTSGYRHNREVAAVIEVSDDHPEEAATAAAVLNQLREGVARINRREVAEFLAAIDKLVAQAQRWTTAGDSNPAPLWSDASQRLFDTFLSAWSDGPPVERIAIVSPFWSETGRKDSPLRSLLTRLREQNKLASSCRVELYLDATRLEDGGYAAAFPAGFAIQYDDIPGVEVVAHAVDPSVDPSDLDVKVELTAARVLHAKIVVCEGGRQSLVYAGSANFTGAGWGIRAMANAEAGYLWTTTPDAATSVLPPSAGGPVAVGSGTILGPPVNDEDDEPERYWPSFLSDVALQPAADDDELELFIAWDATAPAVFTIHTVSTESEAPEHLLTAENGPGGTSVPLPRRLLNHLLIEREVLVGEPGTNKQAKYPVNLAPGEARLRLPLAPNAARPGEDALVAYYQGRVAFEDLFPEPGTEGPDVRPGPHAVVEAGVDTSKIQSYQVRAFVEALPGIRQELERARGPRSLVEFAYLGAVSPVALARSILDGVTAGLKSPTAAAFELVELERVVANASTTAQDDATVHEVSANALVKIAAARAKVKAFAPSAFTEASSFTRYEAAVDLDPTVSIPEPAAEPEAP